MLVLKKIMNSTCRHLIIRDNDSSYDDYIMHVFDSKTGLEHKLVLSDCIQNFNVFGIFKFYNKYIIATISDMFFKSLDYFSSIDFEESLKVSILDYNKITGKIHDDISCLYYKNSNKVFILGTDFYFESDAFIICVSRTGSTIRVINILDFIADLLSVFPDLMDYDSVEVYNKRSGIKDTNRLTIQLTNDLKKFIVKYTFLKKKDEVSYK